MKGLIENLSFKSASCVWLERETELCYFLRADLLPLCLVLVGDLSAQAILVSKGKIGSILKSCLPTLNRRYSLKSSGNAVVAIRLIYYALKLMELLWPIKSLQV